MRKIWKLEPILTHKAKKPEREYYDEIIVRDATDEGNSKYMPYPLAMLHIDNFYVRKGIDSDIYEKLNLGKSVTVEVIMNDITEAEFE